MGDWTDNPSLTGCWCWVRSHQNLWKKHLCWLTPCACHLHGNVRGDHSDGQSSVSFSLISTARLPCGKKSNQSWIAMKINPIMFIVVEFLLLYCTLWKAYSGADPEFWERQEHKVFWQIHSTKACDFWNWISSIIPFFSLMIVLILFENNDQSSSWSTC